MNPLIYAILAVAVFGVGTVAFLLLAPGPRRSRAYKRAQALVRDGNWMEALQVVAALKPERQPSAWQARLQHVAGEAHQLAIDATLKSKEFEEALTHAQRAAELLDLDTKELQGRVVEGALAEARRLFAAGPTESAALHALLDRIAQLAGSEPAEASFWNALSLIRQGQLDPAYDLLTRINQGDGKNVLDVPLYLGMLTHRLGKPQEALRALSDANRIDPNCPFVPWQMGVSIMATNGDSAMAMRALQRALGSRGLGQWQSQPDRLWVEAMPEGKSWVRRLAARHRYVCPILGADLTVVLRQGQLALAQAHYKQERFQEAADLYGKLMQDAPPTLLLMRGYGLSLARLGQHDQAYKHLRLALEQEDPKDPFTAGYLALCGAMGKPTKADDKPRNVTWSLKLMAKYPQVGSAEWASLLAAVHAEATRHRVPTAREDQELLCDALAAVQAHDARAAQAYSTLASGHPDAVKPIHAWLYARAAAAHNFASGQDLDLFTRTFARSAEARAFFDKQGWDFRDVEYTFLARCAKEAPGRFPEALGPDYAAKGEAFLLQRSAEQEQAGKKVPARESVEVLLRLSPANLPAHDRLACLHYRQGDLDRSVALLDGWRALAPGDHWPLVRRAILEQERGDAGKRIEAIEGALRLTRGPLRASIAFLGARLALRECFRDNSPLLGPRLLLEEALREQPDHKDAMWCLAAVHSVAGDRPALAAMAPKMYAPDVADGRFHFFGAVTHLAAGDHKRVAELADRAAKTAGLEIESRFVLAWARLRIGDVDSAVGQLRKVAEATDSPSSPLARAVLGQVHYGRGEAEDAVRWWSALDPSWRAKLGLDAPLRQTVLLAGLEALNDGQFEQAAEQFREAGKLGLRDKRLGQLIALALVKAGQRLLYDEARRAGSR